MSDGSGVDVQQDAVAWCILQDRCRELYEERSRI
jgi:hypothetical protein